MSEDICFEALLEICFWILLNIFFEIGVAVLMSMGYSRMEAEGILTSSVCLIILVLVVVFELLRRKKLGKAVVLDTDGDGEISEEEWASAGQDMDEGVDEEDSPSSKDDASESEKDGDWWEEEK